MGIFSAKKKTYVSSTVYNLAGDINDRPDYLKSVVLGNMLTQKRFKPAQTIISTYQGGPGTRLRAYHRWARTNYRQIGISRDQITGKREFNAEAVAAAMLADFQITAFVDWIDSGRTDITMWGRQWMREYLPLKEPTDTWRVDFIEATNEAMIVFNDGTPPAVFKPQGYRTSGDWLYVSYSRPLTTNRWTTPKLFIYERGTGSAALDAMFLTAASTGEYIPFIPFRHESKFISPTYKPAVYEEAKSAYKKAIGNKYDDLIDKIADNQNIGDIDFAYVVFGVPFNTKDNASRKYMFAYFKHLMGNQVSSAAAYNSWAANQADTQYEVASWLNWRFDQEQNPAGDPLTGAAPYRPGVNSPPSNSVVITDNGPGATNLKLEMKWNSIQLTGGIGLGKPGAKKGEVWFTFVGSQTINASAYTNDEAENLKIDTIEAYHQVTDGTWEKLTIRGMQHINHIYDGKTVEITAAQALVDSDESGFIVPIHYDVFREMSLVDATQMSTQSATIVFNSYQVVKQKWYQTGWFKVILFIVIIAVVFVTGGFAAGGVGLLGTNAGVGMALGFAGVAATIAGVVANMVAAMILTKLITYVSVEVLGEKIGYIVAAIASFVALNVGVGLQSGQTLAMSLTNIMTPMNLLNLTNSVGNAYSQMLQQDTMGIIKKTNEALDDYREQSLKLQENYAENFGYGSAVFDPMSLTGVDQNFFSEPSETFLSRTLLTGSDIAQMGNDLITNFVELTLKNEFSED